MIEAYLVRDVRSSNHTLGTFIIDGNMLSTIERAWRDNRRNESCIPPGRYLCKFLPRSASGKYKNCYHLQNVPGRGGILIHNGNLASHSKGCIILGSKRGFLSGQRAVMASKIAMRKLARITKKKDFYLTVTGG
jgi:hypothetical protein